MPTAADGPTPELVKDKSIQIEFAWKVHGYTNDYIRFADPKAAFGMAAVSGLVACLFSLKAHQYPSIARVYESGYAAHVIAYSVAVVASFALLLASAVIFTTVISPRLWRIAFESIKHRIRHWVTRLLGEEKKSAPKDGLIFWEEVLAQGSAEAYVKHLNSIDAKQALKEIANHTYTLAGVASAKYARLKLGIGTGVLGCLFAVVVIYCN